MMGNSLTNPLAQHQSLPQGRADTATLDGITMGEWTPGMVVSQRGRAWIKAQIEILATDVQNKAEGVKNDKNKQVEVSTGGELTK